MIERQPTAGQGPEQAGLGDPLVAFALAGLDRDTGVVTPYEYGVADHIFRMLYEDGSPCDPAAVQRWAIGRGCEPAAAKTVAGPCGGRPGGAARPW